MTHGNLEGYKVTYLLLLMLIDSCRLSLIWDVLMRLSDGISNTVTISSKVWVVAVAVIARIHWTLSFLRSSDARSLRYEGLKLWDLPIVQYQDINIVELTISNEQSRAEQAQNKQEERRTKTIIGNAKKKTIIGCVKENKQIESGKEKSFGTNCKEQHAVYQLNYKDISTHHSEMQWASSIATRDIGSPSLNISRNSSFKNLSGETKSTWT